MNYFFFNIIFVIESCTYRALSNSLEINFPSIVTNLVEKENIYIYFKHQKRNAYLLTKVQYN